MHYDTRIKLIFQEALPGLLRLLGLPAAAEYLTVEFPKSQKAVSDLVIRLVDGRILHVEFQSKNDSRMVWRCLDYWRAIGEQWPAGDIVQVVVFMGDENLRMVSRIDRGELHYRYTILDLRDVPASVFLSSESESERAIAVLCHSEDPRATIEAILGSWKHLPAKELTEKIANLSVLSQLRKRDTIVREVADAMPVEIDIRENAFYKWGVEEATPKAEARGEAKGEGKLIVKYLQHKFGTVPDYTLSRIANADVATLDRWADRMYSAATLDAVFAD